MGLKSMENVNAMNPSRESFAMKQQCKQYQQATMQLVVHMDVQMKAAAYWTGVTSGFVNVSQGSPDSIVR